MRELEHLYQKLTRRERELDLVLAIDELRDTIVEPTAMLTAIISTLVNHLSADMGLLCLLDPETAQLELKAVSDRCDIAGDLELVSSRLLLQRASEADGVIIWTGDQVQELLGPTPLADTFQLATMPVQMGNRRLGVLLLARADTAFSADDVALLEIAESQIDSAVIQAHTYYELQQRNKELETIYRVDRIRDQGLPFDDMLHAVLQELSTAIQAEMGFIMLYNPAGRQLELRAVTHDDLFQIVPYQKTIDRVANEALEQAQLVWHNDLGDALRSVMCIPLILRHEIIGVLGVVNRYGPRGFSQEDRRLLSAIASQMDTAIFESLERRRLRRVLGRSVDPRVLERLLTQHDTDFLKGERREISVLYSDLRGSTRLAERTEPELLVGFVNDYLGHMTDVILHHEGTLDKYMGDEVMALFGAPFSQSDHALRAVQAGLEMQRIHREVMQTWQGRGMEPVSQGVGIATGELIVGEMGCPQRTDYTVIGRAANLGSRICAVAAPGQVLISEATFHLVREQVEATPMYGLQLKGIERGVTAYHVLGVR